MKPLLLFLIMLFYAFSIVNAQSQQIITIPDSTIQLTDSLLIPVKTSSLQTSDNIISYQFNLSYDSTKLQYVNNLLTGTIAQNGSVSVNSNIEGILNVSYMTTTPLVGSGAILKLQFNPVQTGITNLTVSDFLYNTDTITNINNAVITIINCQSVSISDSVAICLGQTYTVNNHDYTATGIYNDTLPTIAGCDSIIITNLTVKSLPAIHGIVEYSGGFIGSGDAKVRLFETGTYGNHHLIDSVFIGANGSFTLQNFPEGNYYLHVKLNNNSGYQHVHDTYYDSTFQWFNATIFTMQCGTDTGIIIHMFETTPQNTGNGHMQGKVKIYTNTGNKLVGEPVPGAEITLEQEPDDDPIANCATDTSGLYVLTGIPEGSYTFYVDVPGFPMIQTYSGVTVSQTDTLFTDLNFYVDTTDATSGIYTESITKITKFETPDFSVEFYPNPVKNDFNIEYNLTNQSNVSINIIDITGKVNKTLLTNNFQEGKHTCNFGKDKFGLKAGIYFLKLTIDKNIYLKKIVIQ